MAHVALEKSQTQAASTSSGIRRFFRRYGWGYAFVLPSMLTFTIFVLIPVLWSFLISLQDFKIRVNST